MSALADKDIIIQGSVKRAKELCKGAAGAYFLSCLRGSEHPHPDDSQRRLFLSSLRG
jgi:hypothetical protein